VSRASASPAQATASACTPISPIWLLSRWSRVSRASVPPAQAAASACTVHSRVTDMVAATAEQRELSQRPAADDAGKHGAVSHETTNIPLQIGCSSELLDRYFDFDAQRARSHMCCSVLDHHLRQCHSEAATRTREAVQRHGDEWVRHYAAEDGDYIVRQAGERRPRGDGE
jgi:hypothetical protein